MAVRPFFQWLVGRYFTNFCGPGATCIGLVESLSLPELSSVSQRLAALSKQKGPAARSSNPKPETLNLKESELPSPWAIHDSSKARHL